MWSSVGCVVVGVVGVGLHFVAEMHSSIPKNPNKIRNCEILYGKGFGDGSAHPAGSPMGGVLACFKLIRSLSSSCAVAASLSVREALKMH